MRPPLTGHWSKLTIFSGTRPLTFDPDEYSFNLAFGDLAKLVGDSLSTELLTGLARDCA